MARSESSLRGALLGTAVGDAIGLPYEGLSRRRASRLFGGELKHRLLGRRGMVSDDTEHACIVMQAMLAAGNDSARFEREFARRLRNWLWSLPAGIGLATLKATIKLSFGCSPQRSGVFSAGNGPAMRSAVLGAAIDDLNILKRFVKVATRVTHTDPKAEYGALAVALAARVSGSGDPPRGDMYIEMLHEALPEPAADPLHALVAQAVRSVGQRESTAAFADSLGLSRGVSGYVYHTVPVALHAWLSHPADFRAAVSDIVACGGDTDTTAAIVGGIVGAGVGPAGIPRDWLAGIWEWPRSVEWMDHLAQALWQARQRGEPAPPPRLPAWGLLPRNLLFAGIVLAHGFRRLAPPY